MSKNTKTKTLKKAITKYKQTCRDDIISHLNNLDKESKIVHLKRLINVTGIEENSAIDYMDKIVYQLRKEVAKELLYFLQTNTIEDK